MSEPQTDEYGRIQPPYDYYGRMHTAMEHDLDPQWRSMFVEMATRRATAQNERDPAIKGGHIAWVERVEAESGMVSPARPPTPALNALAYVAAGQDYSNVAPIPTSQGQAFEGQSGQQQPGQSSQQYSYSQYDQSGQNSQQQGTGQGMGGGGR